MGNSNVIGHTNFMLKKHASFNILSTKKDASCNSSYRSRYVTYPKVVIGGKKLKNLHSRIPQNMGQIFYLLVIKIKR
jgi:hypothetical protein